MLTERGKVSRSPLKAEPCGIPGQSLDEEIARLVDDDGIAWVSVLVMMLGVTTIGMVRLVLSKPRADR